MSLGSIVTHLPRLPGLPTSKSIREGLTLKNLLGYPLDEDKNAAIRETAWLDGLRGVAAFLVMIYHYNLHYFYPPAVEAPFGSVDTWAFENQNGKIIAFNALWRLPILRVFMAAGHVQVSIFFVLSGFVLSWGPLGNVRAGKNDKAVQSLGSAVFRRWLRLYVPVFAVTLWQAFEVYFDFRVVGAKDKQSNIFAQLWDWAKDCEKFANPFMINRDNYNSLHGYDWTVWTIPYEFVGSLLVYLVLLATGRFRHSGKRAIVMFGVAAYACIRGEWSMWLFASGMLLSSYVRQSGGFQKLSENTTVRSQAGWTALLILGLLLGGVPEKSTFYNRPGYEWTENIIPDAYRGYDGGGRWLWNWSGIFFIVAACHLSSVRRLLEYSWMRYLGRISYMLYLTHRITLNLWGNVMKKVMFDLFGRGQWIDAPSDGTEPFWFKTFLCWLAVMGTVVPVALVSAHWWERLVDRPSTRLARSLDDWFLQGSTDALEPQGNGSILPSHSAHVQTEERGVEMVPTAASRESISREEATALLEREEAPEMQEIDPRPLTER